MSDSDASAPRLKSAYEAALEKLESRGISRPDEEALSEATRAAMTEARRRTDAKLAELEIMHRDDLARVPDPMARAEAEERYRIDRRRIEDALERELSRLREGGDAAP